MTFIASKSKIPNMTHRAQCDLACTHLSNLQITSFSQLHATQTKILDYSSSLKASSSLYLLDLSQANSLNVISCIRLTQARSGFPSLSFQWTFPTSPWLPKGRNPICFALWYFSSSLHSTEPQQPFNKNVSTDWLEPNPPSSTFWTALKTPFTIFGHQCYLSVDYNSPLVGLLKSITPFSSTRYSQMAFLRCSSEHVDLHCL